METAQSRVDAGESAFWENKFKLCKDQRQQYENQWFINLAFLFGRQWAVWRKTTTGNRLVDPPAPRNRVRLITNLLLPAVRRETAKKCKEEPIFYVNPATTEASDRAAARAAENLADFILRNSEFRKTRRNESFWDSVCGTGFYQTLCLEPNGKIDISAISPWHLFFPDLQEEEIEDQSFIIHARAVSKEKVLNTWGADVEPDVSISGTSLEQKFFTALGINNQIIMPNKLVYVKEIWIKPGMVKGYPMGGYLVMAGTKIIYRYTKSSTDQMSQMEEAVSGILNPNPNVRPTEYPFDHGQYPFKKTVLIAAGRLYGMSTLEHAISLQREYNKTRSQAIETKNRTSKPALMFQKGSIDPKKVTNEPGQMIPVPGGVEFPRYLEPPTVPGYAQEEVQIIKQDINDIFHKFELPPGVHAATAIAALQEESDTSLLDSIASQEDAIQGVGQQALSLIQQWWDVDYITKVVSRNGAQDAWMFKQADIKGNTDLRIQPGSMTPKSVAAKQAFIMELVDRGLPLEKALRYLEMNETSQLFEESQVDAKQAQRENITMASQTEPVELPRNPWDNDMVHVYEHGLFMKSNDFELLDPVIKQVFANHYLQHQQYIQGVMPNAGPIPSGQIGQPGPQQPEINPNQPA